MDQPYESPSLTAVAPFNPSGVAVHRAPAGLRAEAAAALGRLRSALDAAFAAVPDGAGPYEGQSAGFARLIRSALAQAAAEDVLLTPEQCEGAADCYRRHLLIADPHGRYAAAALVWQPGQASPVHGHHTWCGYTVLGGVLQETLYEWNAAAGCASAVRTQPREASAVSYVRAGLAAIHRLANTGARPAISLHVYGVQGERIATHVNHLVSAPAEPELNVRVL